MIPRFAVLCIALITSGCVGSNHWYKTDADLQAYGDGLQLQTMTVARAEARLIEEGFKCEPDGAGRKCERIYSGRYGGQWQHVLIGADTTNAGRTIVFASVTSVMI